MSYALGVHYLVPFTVGIAGYALAQGVRLLLRTGRPSAATLGREVACDLYLLVLFLVVIYVHFHIKMWMPLINPADYDADLFAIDRALRPAVDLAFRLRAALAPAIPAVDHWYQVGFLMMFALTLWSHAVERRRFHLHALVAILLLEMTGALAYLAAPAVGPFVFEAGINPLASAAQHLMHASFLTVRAQGAAWLAVNGGRYFTAPPAAMPSLHVAGAFIMSWYALRARSVVAPLMIVLTLWIVIESVAARWHYLADLPAGLALAAAVMAVAGRICRPRSG
ncbi:MAG: phosphatase PAP2 family protein [Rhodospirillaceae bacterium]|nr:phosphatase PAP2 family protein [Rhodospirillaceae bacterium]